MTVVRNQVRLVLAVAGIGASAVSGFVRYAPNRLVSGEPLVLWQAADAPIVIGLCGLALFIFIACLLPQTRALQCAVVAAAAALLLLCIYAAGESAAALVQAEHPAARTSFGVGFWTLSLCAVLTIVDALQRLRTPPGARLLVAAVLSGAVGLLALSGALDALSLAREYAIRRDAFARELGQHCLLVLAALGLALLIGAPLGVLAARRDALRQPLFAVLNLVQTIPSVALFGLLIAPLSALAAAFPGLRALGVQGIGAAPAILALVGYALLPIVRNTQTGIAAVDPAAVDAARGLGFTARQIFRYIELPLAMPTFLAGLRIVLVQTVGLAVVAALIGTGGLGTFVFQGVGQYAVDLVLLGAIPAILLALAADLVMRTLVDAVQPNRGGPGRGAA